MTLTEGRRVKLAADLLLAGSLVPAGHSPEDREHPDAAVGSLSLGAGTEGTVERVHGIREEQESIEVREYVRLKSLLDDFGHQMPPGSRKQLEEQVGALEAEWTAHRQRRPRVTVRVRLDNGFVLDALEDVFTPV
ncbi:hypothetical protein [Streptomyces sp. NPDC089799]|uniref:hypothetical protein n=1 Tax=Streptomyces sp. NPDC089799 TaxID=3155066 RepID=UPI0034214FF1